VRKGTPGFTPTKIENKIALRCVQNADMLFERCFILDSARLPGEGFSGWGLGVVGFRL
jgi:alkylation response protein AidB-like acyl-CoA dehydrogenase